MAIFYDMYIIAIYVLFGFWIDMLGLSIDWVLNMVLKDYDVSLIMNLICCHLTLVTILIIELYVWTVKSYLIIYLGIYILVMWLMDLYVLASVILEFGYIWLSVELCSSGELLAPLYVPFPCSYDTMTLLLEWIWMWFDQVHALMGCNCRPLIG